MIFAQIAPFVPDQLAQLSGLQLVQTVITCTAYALPVITATILAVWWYRKHRIH